MSRDEIYAKGGEGQPFEFSEKVAGVFEDMIRRSVPGYELTLTAIEAVAGRECGTGTRIYDLGCSLGASTQAAWRGVRGKDVPVIGIDSSSAMVTRAAHYAEGLTSCSFEEGDATNFPMQEASLIVLNFTLQFVPIEEREALLQRCYDALVPGGVLYLSEKFVSENPADEEWLRELHWEFKRQQGYSEMEIAGKREAIEKMLLPESPELHVSRLQGVGFGQVTRVLQCLNFGSWVARKN